MGLHDAAASSMIDTTEHGTEEVNNPNEKAAKNIGARSCTVLWFLIEPESNHGLTRILGFLLYLGFLCVLHGSGPTSGAYYRYLQVVQWEAYKPLQLEKPGVVYKCEY
jgi:hypothetical protein